MTYSEKIDALDLVINTLKEHEKALDKALNRLEALLAVLEPEAAKELMRRFYE